MILINMKYRNNQFILQMSAARLSIGTCGISVRHVTVTAYSFKHLPPPLTYIIFVILLGSSSFLS